MTPERNIQSAPGQTTGGSSLERARRRSRLTVLPTYSPTGARSGLVRPAGNSAITLSSRLSYLVFGIFVFGSPVIYDFFEKI